MDGAPCGTSLENLFAVQNDVQAFPLFLLLTRNPTSALVTISRIRVMTPL